MLTRIPVDSNPDQACQALKQIDYEAFSYLMHHPQNQEINEDL